MKKVLFVALHRPNRSPSQRFRFEQYLDHLKANGFDYDFSFVISAEDDRIFYSPGNYLGKMGILVKSVFTRLGDVLKASQYDIIFVQREAWMLGSAVFEKLYSRSKAKLIFDFDDSIWLQNVSEANKALGWLKNASKTREIIEVSDMVFAGNQYLADYAGQYNNCVKIIPTTVDTDKFQKMNVPKKPESVEIGWTGSFSTIEHFKYGIPVLLKIKEKYGDRVHFKVVGDGNYRSEELGVQGLPWKSETEVQDLSSMDIGIMPLPDDQWTRGKCGFKGLTYMSLEIPAVMSPVGVNKTIIADGVNGFLADSEAEWIEKLSLLIESAELRKKLGAKGRETVVNRYSIHSQKENYVQFFKEVLNG